MCMHVLISSVQPYGKPIDQYGGHTLPVHYKPRIRCKLVIGLAKHKAQEISECNKLTKLQFKNFNVHKTGFKRNSKI